MHIFVAAPDSEFVRTALEVLHHIEPTARIVHTHQLSAEALRKRDGQGLVLIDLEACAHNAQALIHQIATQSATPVVALSSAVDQKSIDRAMEGGAAGYLPKSYSRPLIEGVLRLVMGGEPYRPHFAGRPVKSSKRDTQPTDAAPSTPAAELMAGLTSRERDVLIELARGCSNLEIGRRLDMREGTVKTHLYAIFKKLCVRNRASAALFGARLAEMRQEQLDEAEQGKLNLSWLQPEMSHRRVRAGQWIFRLGDVGSELFYVQRGKVTLPEIGVTIGPGEVFGEIGIFTPEHRRTCSARCESEADLFSLTSGQVRRIYFGNPQFAFFILTLIATRLMADRQRDSTQS
jgi:DNA-binding NarL/FixJ family response regulator